MSNGVKSLILDDDLCGCNTLLFVGSSMCLIHTDRYKVRHDLAGVGSLTTTGCDADEPSPANGLVLFFNDNARTTEDLTTTVAPTTARTTVRTTTTTTKRSRKATPRPEHSYNERHDTGIIKASEEPTDDSDVVVRIEGDSVVATVRGDRRSSLLAPRLANPLSATEEDNPAGAAATEDNRATDKERTAKKRMEEEAEAAEEEKKRVAEEIRAAAAEKKRIEEEAKAAAAEEKKKAEENEAKAAAAERKARRRAIRDEQVRRKLGLYRPGDPRLRGFGPGGPLRASGYGELSQNPDFGAHPQQARISDSNLQSSTEYGGYPAQAYEGQAGYAGGQRRIRYPLTRSGDVAAGRGFGAGLTPIGAPERYLPPRDAGYSNQYRSPPPRFAPPVQYGLVKVTADDDAEEPGIEELRDRDLRYEGFLRDERGGHYRQQPSYGAAPSYAGASAYGAPPTGFYGPPPTHRGFERVRSK
ncbi:PREDICTED: uncharacterized protein LOC106820725 [Priapulus caudatus]|uniref:Uncharacterized protein LOC106820725 n=1 Tax=Priapulus caudatus TaxID=37621 RepID=A0ABM1F8F5_PRICU|nr:PREDICTED: uncharacterized protein LOC106820725 [Priapulus caudatus]